MGIKLQGGNNSTNLASVNALNQLQVVMPKDSAGGLTAGFVQISSEVDAGTVLKPRSVLPFECSDDYRLRVGVDQSVFNSTFEGTTALTTQWYNATTTTANTQGNGFFNLNSSVAANMVASGAASYLRTWRHFPTFGTYPTYVEMWIREGGYNTINAISEWGYLYLTAQATQQPLDGIFFRRLSGGALKAIITNNALDLIEIDINTTNVPSRDGVGVFDPAETNHYLISFHNDTVRFWINDVAVCEISLPAALPQFTGSSNLPVGFRMVNLNITPVPRQLSVGYVNVGLGDQNVNKPWSHAMSGTGQGAYQVQIGGTPGPTVTRGTGALGHPTSGTARIAGSYVSTTLPALSSLGGLWTSPAISTLTSDSDYPLFAYQNPTGSATLPGKTLYVTGTRIGDASATVGATANAIFLSYIVQVENSASATNTADAATTTAGKSIVIGGQGFTAGDGVGTMKPGFEMTFNPPLAISAGKYFTVIARPFGTVTSNTLVVTGSVGVNGYFE
jgi:hypothetical protein